MNKWRFDFAAALAAGVIILFLGALMGQYVEVLWPEHDFEYWMHRYQTVVVSFVAIVGLVGVSNQIKATQRQTKAALMTAHKPEFGALLLVQGLFDRLKQHVDFFMTFAVAGGGAGTITAPPEVGAGDITTIRSALNFPGIDPFGLLNFHRQWQRATVEFSAGRMNAEDIGAYANYIRLICDTEIDRSKAMVETLHAQIEASV